MDNSIKIQAEQELMRHSMSHILAMAVLKLFPNTKLGIGPAIENGFYYEVDAPVKISYKDLTKIEAEMKKIIAEEIPFKQIITPKEQAFDTLMQSGQIYKTELLRQIEDESVSFYKTGDFYDLCRGPHIAHTGQAGHFKLLRIGSSYWLGEKNRPKLQRIEGVAFLKQKDLEVYLESQKEIIQRDYRKIGRKLNLITYDNDIGNNLMVWLPKGNIVREELKKFIINKLNDLGTFILETPSLARFTLYRDYFESDKVKSTYLPLLKTSRNEYLLKNDCFFHHAGVFRSNKKSYKQLPVRYTEFFEVYRSTQIESQSDIEYTQTLQTNTFLRLDQVEGELQNCLKIINELFKFLKIDNFQIQARLPDKKGNKEQKTGLKIIEGALSKEKLAARIISSEYYNDGAELGFYVKDLIGNNHKLISIRLDFVSCSKEELYYINKNNLKEIPVVIRFNVIESFEILLKILLEKNSGIFDVWLAPVQCIVIAISEKYHDAAIKIQDELRRAHIRVDINLDPDTMQNKIRKAEIENIPYMLILGEKELNTNSISLRQRNGGELGLVRVEEFIERIKNEIEQKAF